MESYKDLVKFDIFFFFLRHLRFISQVGLKVHITGISSQGKLKQWEAFFKSTVLVSGGIDIRTEIFLSLSEQNSGSLRFIFLKNNMTLQLYFFFLGGDNAALVRNQENRLSRRPHLLFPDIH